MQLNKMWPGLTGLLGAFALFSQPAFAVPPANDNFAGAQLLTGDWGSVSNSSHDATTEPGEPLIATYNTAGSSIWYKWTAPFTAVTHMGTAGSGVVDTVMGVYTGSSVNSLTTITTNDDNSFNKASEVTYNAVAGTTYYIDIAGVGGEIGVIFLGWDQNLSPNDNFANAQTISGASGTVDGNTSDASIETPEPLRNTYNCDRSVWYKWTAPGTGATSFDLSGSLLLTDGLQNSVMGVYTGSALNALTSVTTDDESGDESTAKVTFDAVGGTTYYIAVAGKFGASGNIRLNWLQQRPPTAFKTSIAVSNAAVVEGNSGTINAVFTVSLSGPSTVPVSVKYATSNDTAVATFDYTAQSSTLNFAPGETSKTVSIAVKGDLIDEIDERFNFNLSNAANTNISDNLGICIITDDDAPPTLTVSGAAISEGNTGTKTLNFNVKLSVASSKTVTVSAKSIPGTTTETTEPATAGVDYVALPATTLTFAPGELTKSLSVTINGDMVDEANETFNVVISAPGNATIATANAIGTLTDDDVTPIFSVNDVTITEGNTGTVNAAFTVNLSAASGRVVKVTASTLNGTAAAVSDYIALTGSILSFLPGQTSKVVNIAIKGDLIDELNETFQLKLSAAVNATIGDASGTGIITDDDITPAISATATGVTEKTGSQLQLPFTLKLSNPSSRAITVKIQTGLAYNDYGVHHAKADADFVAIPQTILTFEAGETTKVVNVTVNDDEIDEYDEKLALNLIAPSNATLATNSAEAFIFDNDAQPFFIIEDGYVQEGDDGYGELGPGVGSRTRNFRISLSKHTEKELRFSIKTVPSPLTPATADVDYVAIPLTSFQYFASQYIFSTTIPFTVKDDNVYEGRERFRVQFSDVLNASLPDTFSEIVIDDTDDHPAMSVDDVSVVEGNSSTKTVTLTAKLAKPGTVAIDTAYRTIPDTASNHEDFQPKNGTFRFAPGQTTATATITIVGDTIAEGNESFQVEFTNDVSRTNATVTIIDDDSSARSSSPSPSAGSS